MSTPEGYVKGKLKHHLREAGVFFFMPVQTGYGAASVDFLCCDKGSFVAIETKAPGKKLTRRQELTMTAIRAAGGRTYVVTTGIAHELVSREILG